LNGKDNLFLDRAKSRLNNVKKALKNAGIEVDTYGDITAYLRNSDEGTLLDFITRNAPLRQEIKQNKLNKKYNTNSYEYESYNEDEANFDDVLDYVLRLGRQR